MRIISVQSIAGGTGVTSVATEIIADKLRAKEAILAIDLGNTQMLGRKNLGRGFETLGDASLIFGAWPAGVWLRQEALPRLCLLDLREQRHPYDACEEEVLLALTCYDSVGDILDRLRDQMASFATRFDSCVVDLSQAPDLLRRLFIAVSGEVHFCERLMSESHTWEAFREKFLDGEEYKPDQIWIKHPDRGEWRPQVIEDCPGMRLVDA